MLLPLIVPEKNVDRHQKFTFICMCICIIRRNSEEINFFPKLERAYDDAFVLCVSVLVLFISSMRSCELFTILCKLSRSFTDGIPY